ncbi:MAG: HAD family hydrolase [Bacteroidales bacterium]|nr:HAD family hydrolase [Bacteroidales bacterium]
MKNNIKIIAFDADDTLWVNELYFQEAEKQFCILLQNYMPQDLVSEELFKTEMQNLHLYGYGAKGFVLCMIETAIRISNSKLPVGLIDKIIKIGHELLQKPIELLQYVPETLEQLKEKYKLIVATKGDLLDQERKLNKSGLKSYFHHIEIMSDKKPSDYQKLLKNLACKPENFLMIGNSIKSDILPVLELGGYAGHIPYSITWTHEQYEHEIKHDNFFKLKSFNNILNYL